MHSISMLTITSDKQLSSLACMEKLRKIISLPQFLMICSIIIHIVSAASDTINSSQTMRDGETMISSGGIFELGFFSPGSSAKRYLGMWYKNITIPTIVWVANRESPLPNKSGALKITEQGLLVILNDTDGIIVWSSNRSSSSLRNPVAKLQDSGNLVVKDANDDGNNYFLWQSFDHPTDTLLPGMGLGWNFITREETYLSSWRSGDDPSKGNFTVHVDPTGYPQLILRRGDIVQSRLGPWNGIQFSGGPQNEIPIYGLSLSRNKNEAKYRVKIVNSSDLLRTTVSQTGISQRWRWDYQRQTWNVYVNLPGDNCDTYGLCGPHGRCNIGKSASCECLDYRFVPKGSEAWLRGIWSSGCVRRTNLSCQGDAFLKYSGIKMPDARFSWFNESMTTLRQCREECSKNCTCMAYTQLDVRAEGSGCLFYSGDLVDIRDTSPGGQVLYIRMASSESESKGNNRKKLIEILVPVALMVLLGLSLILYL